MDIAESNKLIAEFIISDIDFLNKFGGQKYQFHYSWDWLIPVVEKIEKFDEGVCSVLIMGDECDIAFSSKYRKDGEDYDAPNFRQRGQNKIQSTYNAIIQFIQWYNEQNSNL